MDSLEGLLSLGSKRAHQLGEVSEMQEALVYVILVTVTSRKGRRELVKDKWMKSVFSGKYAPWERRGIQESSNLH